MKTKKNYIYIGFLLIIIFLVVLTRIKRIERIEMINNCLTSDDSSILLNCSYSHRLSPQQEYDMYYNQAEKHKDQLFLLGFQMAINRCDTFRDICDMKDKETFFKTLRNCAYTYNYNCVEGYLNQLYSYTDQYVDSHDLQLDMFVKTMEKIIKEDNKNCLIEFYQKLNENEKKSLPTEISDICKK